MALDLSSAQVDLEMSHDRETITRISHLFSVCLPLHHLRVNTQLLPGTYDGHVGSGMGTGHQKHLKLTRER